MAFLNKFIPNRTEFCKSVNECLDSNLHVPGIFFDLSFDFDTLSFMFIIDEYYNLGFRGIFSD